MVCLCQASDSHTWQSDKRRILGILVPARSGQSRFVSNLAQQAPLVWIVCLETNSRRPNAFPYFILDLANRYTLRLPKFIMIERLYFPFVARC